MQTLPHLTHDTITHRMDCTMDIVLQDVYIVIAGIFYGIERVVEYLPNGNAIVLLDTWDEAFVSLSDIRIEHYV